MRVFDIGGIFRQFNWYSQEQLSAVSCISDITCAVSSYEDSVSGICQWYDWIVRDLSGTPFDRLSTVNPAEQSDLFLVSTSAGSGAISYAKLSSALVSDLKAALGLKSMAYESSADYSLTSHIHDGEYTRLQVSPSAVSDPHALALFEISDSGSTGPISVNYTPIVVGDPPYPEIGTLRFMYSAAEMPPIGDAEVNAAGFDGWAYPDGQVITVQDRTRFAKALAVYGDSEGRIALPDLRGLFLKAQPSPTDDHARKVDARQGVQRHAHGVNSISMSGRIDLAENYKLYNYDDSGKGNAKSHIHNGDLSKREKAIRKIPFKDFQLEQIVMDLTTGPVTGSHATGEFSPRHVRMPVMVYIGGVI